MCVCVCVCVCVCIIVGLKGFLCNDRAVVRAALLEV